MPRWRRNQRAAIEEAARLATERQRLDNERAADVLAIVKQVVAARRGMLTGTVT